MEIRDPKKGYVYVLTNPSMPGLLKIGRTSNEPEQRLDELNTTGVPTPFDLEIALEVHDCLQAEKLVHDALTHYRPSKSREFFRISLPDAGAVIFNVLQNSTIHFVRAPDQLASINEKVAELAEAERNQQREHLHALVNAC